MSAISISAICAWLTVIFLLIKMSRDTRLDKLCESKEIKRLEGERNHWKDRYNDAWEHYDKETTERDRKIREMDEEIKRLKDKLWKVLESNSVVCDRLTEIADGIDNSRLESKDNI